MYIYICMLVHTIKHDVANMYTSNFMVGNV